MKQLLPSEFRRGYTPERVVICEVEKRKVQAIIETCKDFPQYHMENYDHLKRVRKSPDNEETLELILCLEKVRSQQMTVTHQTQGSSGVQRRRTQVKGSCGYQNQGSTSLWPINEGLSFILCLFETVRVVKEEFAEFQVHWPLIFRAPANSQIEHSLEEISFLESAMEEAIDLAEKSVKLGNRFNACLVVDLAKRVIIASSLDGTSGMQRDIDHCIMLLMRQTEKDKKSKFEEQTTENSIQTTIKRPAEMDIVDYFESQNYFCKDMDLVVVQEPCVMCAMALVHSRIRRVYYSLPHDRADWGGLNEKIQVGSIPSLNHRYLVFHSLKRERAANVRECILNRKL
eukprot:TRINITY_DN2055_c0_g1_i3.p1 TRINITY_DN2055_c0_g1~~TRINITY_DN2055_c0_g1_i3.p1  ORF type:complete len:343 (+),score=-17.34 TRINITY_DN2055_c0_g1_i3:64-1092(+)